jgi:hypothetical protein
MTYAASQLIAISGLSQNTGLGISADLATALATAQSTNTLTGILRKIATNPVVSVTILLGMRTKLPGLCLVAPISYTALPATILPADITKSIQNRSAIFFQRGAQGFLGILTRAFGVCQTTRATLASLYSIQSSGFTGIGPGITNHTDLITGGISSKFGPLAPGSTSYLKNSTLYTGKPTSLVTAADIKNGITAVADGILKLVTLYDFQDLATLGTPQGLIVNLYKQGLINTAFLNLLATENITIGSISSSNSTVLTGLLKQLTGNDLQKIIVGTGLQVLSATAINTGADLLDATKLLPVSAVDAIPGGTLIALANQLISLNLTFDNTSSLANAFKNITISDTPRLNALASPIPDADANKIKSIVPKGSGEFGAPLIQELIGTPSGFVHTEALGTINVIAQSLANSTEALALQSAAVTLDSKYTAQAAAKAAYDAANTDTKPSLLPALNTATADVVTAETAFTTAFNNFITVSSNTSSYTTADNAIKSIITQIQTELTNCVLSGTDIYSTQPGTTNTLLTTLSFPTFGVDADRVGVSAMLLACATKDIYGEAIQSILLQGQNEQALKTVGGKSVGVPTVAQVTKIYRAQTGGDLSVQQKENIIDYARNNSLDVGEAITNAALYGYDNMFYTSRGYPSA